MTHDSVPARAIGPLDDISIGEFTYELPKERIALSPLEQRGASRLLRYQVEGDRISHHAFRDLPDLVPPNGVVLWNNTRVVPARLRFRRDTGGEVELFLLAPHTPSIDPAVALASRDTVSWLCMARGMKRLRIGERLAATPDSSIAPGPELSAEIVEKGDEGVLASFSWSENGTFAEIIELFGHTPLPPYIGREERESDRTDYQTVYAAAPGAVAAPTAGLHFTDELIDRLRRRGTTFAEVTLHVGAGTFAPVKVDRVSEHAMHVERFEVSLQTLDRLSIALDPTRSVPITHVGTTTLRTMESLYWIGESILSEDRELSRHPERLPQWYAAGRAASSRDLPDASIVFSELAARMRRRGTERFVGETGLMILPGYRFMTCDRLITNFHQPGSTLILLVAAFLGGERWRRLYETALREGYRFLSYGDASLLERR